VFLFVSVPLLGSSHICVVSGPVLLGSSFLYSPFVLCCCFLSSKFIWRYCSCLFCRFLVASVIVLVFLCCFLALSVFAPFLPLVLAAIHCSACTFGYWFLFLLRFWFCLRLCFSRFANRILHLDNSPVCRCLSWLCLVFLASIRIRPVVGNL